MDRVSNALKYYYEGYNCSQSILLSYCDIFGFDESKASFISSGFGGGMGGMRDKCGALTAMFMLAGLAKSGYDKSSIESKKDLYSLIRFINDKFEEKFQCTYCGELLKKADVHVSNTPSERTKEYYKIRPCAKFIEYAAELVEKYIL